MYHYLYYHIIKGEAKTNQKTLISKMLIYEHIFTIIKIPLNLTIFFKQTSFYANTLYVYTFTFSKFYEITEFLFVRCREFQNCLYIKQIPLKTLRSLKGKPGYFEV